MSPSTVLCRKGSLEFRTDNLSTLTVLKDVLSKEATEENIAVKINYGMARTTECCCNTAIVLVEHWFHCHSAELNPDSVPHMITLVYPLLEQQLMLAKNVQLIDALQVGPHTGQRDPLWLGTLIGWQKFVILGSLINALISGGCYIQKSCTID